MAMFRQPAKMALSGVFEDRKEDDNSGDDEKNPTKRHSTRPLAESVNGNHSTRRHDGSCWCVGSDIDYGGSIHGDVWTRRYDFAVCDASASKRGKMSDGDFTPTANQPLQQAILRANSDSLAHNVCMSEKRTKADKAQREADLLDKKSSHRPPQNQGKKPREDFNQTAVRIVEEAAEKH